MLEQTVYSPEETFAQRQAMLEMGNLFFILPKYIGEVGKNFATNTSIDHLILIIEQGISNAQIPISEIMLLLRVDRESVTSATSKPFKIEEIQQLAFRGDGVMRFGNQQILARDRYLGEANRRRVVLSALKKRLKKEAMSDQEIVQTISSQLNDSERVTIVPEFLPAEITEGVVEIVESDQSVSVLQAV